MAIRAPTGPGSGWDAARAAVALYAGHPAVAFSDLAAEVGTEVRLLRATQAELAAHARNVKPLTVHRSGWAGRGPARGSATVGGPVLVAVMGRPGRFAAGAAFKSYTGLAPRASETGNTDRKGQPMSKAGSSLLRTTLIRAADTARKQDPQLARIYYTQMVDRGAEHLKALCVVAGAPGRTGLGRDEPADALRHLRHRRSTGHPEQAKQIIAEHFTVPDEVRRRRRSTKTRRPATQPQGGRPLSKPHTAA